MAATSVTIYEFDLTNNAGTSVCGHIRCYYTYERISNNNVVRYYVYLDFRRNQNWAASEFHSSYTLTVNIPNTDSPTTKSGTVNLPSPYGTNTLTLGPWYYRKGAASATSMTATYKRAEIGKNTNWSCKIPAGGYYTVTFNGNNGTPSQASKTVEYGKTYGTLPTATRTGYTFDSSGWYTAASGGTKITSSSTVSLTAAQTLYAHWTANTYTVKFRDDDGTTSLASDKTVTYNSTYGSLPTPTKTGNGFVGWFTSKTGGTEIKASTTVSITATQTLYAHWTANTYYLQYNANGGECSVERKQLSYGAQYGTLPAATKTGYTLVGWFTQASGGTQVYSNTTMGAGDTTIYAHWTANTYTVTYDANGGTPATQTKQCTYDSAYVFPSRPTRQGYEIIGWFTAASGGNRVESGTIYKQTSAQTLYAHWNPLSILHLVKNGTPITVTQIYVVKDGSAKRVLGCFIVKNGTAYQGV